MRSFQKLLVLPLALLLVMSSQAFAQQQHVVDPSEVAGTVTQHIATQATSRATIHDALARPEVREMAGRMGVDLTRADAAVDTLSGADLDRAAAAATQVNDSLVGGASTIVISTTTIVIVLLIIILVVLVAD
jgi:hypothetical protein